MIAALGSSRTPSTSSGSTWVIGRQLLAAARAGGRRRPPVSVALSKFFGPPAVVGPTPTAADYTAIRGSRGSSGKATGPARVLHSLADARRLQPRDVLVVDTTAPPWTPLSPPPSRSCPTRAAFSATARWSPASTASPAVVGTGNATSRITDGQMIEVDGDAGIVRLLS